MLILTTSNLTARLKTKIPVSGGQKISHEIEAMCATQPASPRWRPNHEILWHRKIAGHKPARMTRLVCVLLSSNAIIIIKRLKDLILFVSCHHVITRIKSFVIWSVRIRKNRVNRLGGVRQFYS